VPLISLNLQQFLPQFIEGVREQQQPFAFLAYQGALELIRSTRGTEKLKEITPSLILSLKRSIDTRHVPTMRKAMTLLREMLRNCPSMGEVLVAYYRQLLPVLNLFSGHPALASEIEEILTLLETTGGPDAFINIKYVVPMYESRASLDNSAAASRLPSIPKQLH
jgi:hypothetical protein